jgi:hypothetical protein
MIPFAQRRRLTVGVSWSPAHWTPYFAFVRGACVVDGSAFLPRIEGAGAESCSWLGSLLQMR